MRYDAKWRMVRGQHLARSPLCVHCLDRGRITPATEVDHIKSIAEAPELRLCHDNLRSLCKPCHSRRTIQDQGWNKGKRIMGCDVNGIPIDPKHLWRGSNAAK